MASIEKCRNFNLRRVVVKNVETQADVSQPGAARPSERELSIASEEATEPVDMSVTKDASKDTLENNNESDVQTDQPSQPDKLIAPGSARKTGRPVGKQYVEHLLAHMKNQGQSISDQNREVLEAAGGSPATAEVAEPKEPKDGKTVDIGEGAPAKVLAPVRTLPVATNTGSTGGVPVLLLVSSPSAVPATGKQTVLLAAVPALSTNGTAVVASLPTSISMARGSGNAGAPKSNEGDDPALPQPASQIDLKGQEKSDLPPLVDPRLAVFQASESEGTTSQSENEGGEESTEKKPRKGRKKKKRKNEGEEVGESQAGEDGESAKVLDASKPDENGTKSSEDAENQVEVAQGHDNSPPKITDATRPAALEGSKTSVREEGLVDTAKPPTLLPEGDTATAMLNHQGSLPDLKKVNVGVSEASTVGHSLEQEVNTSSQRKEGDVAKQPTAGKLIQPVRPKRKIKHKFLEASDRYESLGRAAHRGRSGGRSRGMKGLAARRGGRGGSLRGKNKVRGRGKLKPRSKIRGRGRWTHRKGSTARKILPKMEVGDSPLQSDEGVLSPLVINISSNHIPLMDQTLAKESPVKLVRRGGFRGSRRRGSTARSQYKNMARRGRGGGIPQTLSREIPEAVVLNVVSPMSGIVTKDSMTTQGPESTTDSVIDVVTRETIQESAITNSPPSNPIQESEVNVVVVDAEGQEFDPSKYPIPFACFKGKARKSAKPKTNTHFGQHKRRMGGLKHRRGYDSDSTDQLSEGSMGPPSSKRFQRSNSGSTFASGDSEDDQEVQISHTGRMVPPSAPTPTKTSQGDHNYGREPPLCCCKLVQNKPITAIANICEALEIVNGKVATCSCKVDEQKVMRPSSRIPFRGYCSRHRKKMMQHHCCPGCGCFCSTGLSMVCTIDGLEHYFHKECIREIDQALYCPHCGEDAKLAKEVTLPDLPNPIKLNILPESVLLSHERIRLPKAFLSSLTGLKGLELREALESHREKTVYTPKAKMMGKSSTLPGRGDSPVMPETPPHQEEGIFQLQLKTGKTITSGMLPQGPSRESLEMAMKFMDPENPRRLRFAPKNLYMASSLGEIEKVLQMLGEGFDPNYHFPSHNRETPVHAAAAKGHLDIVCMLVQAGANIDAEDEDHRTPLHLAVDKEQFECVKFLCRHGARPDHKDDDGTAVVHIATMKGNREILTYLLKLKRVQIDAQDNGGWTPIIWAADNKNNDMVSFLLSYGADPTIRDKEQNIALHWAAYSGSQKVMEEVMNHDTFQESIVNTVNIHGDSPLHVAARENNLGCVTQLLMKKANATICNKEGETPLDCAVNKSDVWMAMEANLRINIYVQKRNLRTERILSRDICRGRENVPIPVINSIDDQPLPNCFLYVADNCETSPLDIDRSIKPMQGCRCDGDCSTDSCPCGQSSVRCWYSPEGQLAEDFNYQEPPLIFECGRACNCWRTCRNRVVQNGLKAHLQLFRTPRMGWGVRTTHDIPKGTFICQYAGELISDAEADKREDDSYLFDLENREGDVYCIDARFYGNISRFINHLCEPNIVPVRVFIEHFDLRFPHIAFFASREIKAFEELGFDYGDKFWTIKSKYFTCNCGSKLCKHSAAEPGQT